MSLSDGNDRLGRNELIGWFNAFLSLNYQKIEETASGAAHCQIFDALYPGLVPLHRVNFNASPYQYITNYKILQTVFTKVGIEKAIPVSALIEGKMQANLEFSQWVKGYFDKVYTGAPYDALSRRKEFKPHPGLNRTTSSSSLSIPSSSSSSQTRARPLKGPSPIPFQANPSENSNNLTPLIRSTSDLEKKEASIGEILVLKSKNADLRVKIKQIENERDFYFNKLRDIEILTSAMENKEPIVQAALSQIQAILYATGEHLFES